MMPHFHVQDEHLMEYAAGSLAEPMALLLATHLALCPSCRKRVAEFEAVGGVLLETLGVEAVDRSLRDTIMARLDEPQMVAETRSDAQSSEFLDLRAPEPLRSYLSAKLEDLAWKDRGPVHEVRILADHVGFTSRLLRIKAGTAMPTHTHRGTELTLVLSGGFTDRGNHYLHGDVATADSTVNHAPVADPGEDCYCFAVNDGPLRLTGRLTRFLNPFIRI